MAAALAPGLSLKLLDLGTNGFEGEVAGAAMAQLLNKGGINAFNFQNSHLRNAGLKAMVAALARDASFSSLDLSQSELQGEAFGVAVAEILNKFRMTFFRLIGNSLENGGFRALAAALAPNASVGILYLDSNNMTGKDAGTVAAQILNKGVVRFLFSLRDNSLGAVGLQAMAASLAPNASVFQLSVSANGLEGEMAGAAAAEILNRGVIQDGGYLDLGRNPLGNAGLNAIADLWKPTKAPLGVLGLQHIVAAGEAAGAAAAQILNKGGVEDMLEFADEGIDGSFLQALAEGLQKGHARPELHISHVSGQEAEALWGAEEANRRGTARKRRNPCPIRRTGFTWPRRPVCSTRTGAEVPGRP